MSVSLPQPLKIAIAIFLLCAPRLGFAQEAAPAPVDRSFDGTWTVTLVAPTFTGDGFTALGFTFKFIAQVKDGVLHGEYRTKDAPPWLSIEGKILPDGSADLTATGITGKPAYSLKNIAAGTLYTYKVKAQFEGSKGTGARVEGRVANYTFVKQ